MELFDKDNICFREKKDEMKKKIMIFFLPATLINVLLLAMVWSKLR